MHLQRRMAAQAELLRWDAPFLPVPEERSGTSAAAAGEHLTRLAKAPLGVRAAAALQLLSAAEFLLAQGWYPERRLLRGARLVRDGAGAAVRLPELPRWRLDDPGFRTPAGQRLLGHDALAARLVLPLLAALLPERRAALAGAVAAALPGETSGRLAQVLGGCGRAHACLQHRQGAGRALWARRLQVPQEGTVWVEEEELLPRLAAAVALARQAGTRQGSIVAGPLDEAEVAQEQARAAATGEALLVLTTLPVAGSVPLAIDGDEGAVWVFPLGGGGGAAHARAARERSAGRARLAAQVLAAGAAAGFAAPPGGGGEAAGRELLASAAARAALLWLSASPVGLDPAEGAALGVGAETWAELERLGLAQRHGGRWRAVQPSERPPDAERTRVLATALPAESLAGMVARALAAGQWQPLIAWCSGHLDEEQDALEVLGLASAVPRPSPLSLLGAEAAVALGRLREAAELLGEVAAAERNATWHLLEAWRCLLVGLLKEAADALTAADGEMTDPRLAARRALLAAELAHQRGDATEERRQLDQAARHGGRLADEAALYRAALEGAAALGRLRRQAWCRWTRWLRARYLHLRGLDAFRRDAVGAAGTALRAALRVSSGLNPLALGELCADLATVHVVRARLGEAERYYGLAEAYLERAGTQRALYVVRANRAGVANDLMRWRQARELLAGVPPPAGVGGELHAAANAAEEARGELVRGRLDQVRATLPRLQGISQRNPAWRLLALAVGSLHLHLALAEGDLGAVAAALAAAEESDRALASAVLAAAGGHDPNPELPPRWGVVPCAAMYAAWRRGEREVARERAERQLARLPREGAVGLARLVRLLQRHGERPDPSWDPLLRRAEKILREAELDGWLATMHAVGRGDPLTVVRALVRALTAGTACVQPEFLDPLARALGVRRVEVWRGGDLLGAWGEGEVEDGALATAGVTVRWGGADDALVRAALEGVALLAGPRLEANSNPRNDLDGLVGSSAALQRVRELIARWGPLPLPVLITGEGGTGKELVAREVHRFSGRRGPLVPVNCAAFPAPILERELFGTVRGAYSGADQDREGLVEAAEGGTLFLDEIGELPLELQAKLLRLVQEREVRRLGSTRVRVVDVRFVAATNRDLPAAVARGEFRADLYYRLAAAVIHLPPLRDRREDIADLALLFCERAAREFQRPGVRLAPAALEALRQAPWPGNARELEWAIRRAVVAAGAGEVLGPERFDLAPRREDTTGLGSFELARQRFLQEYFTALLAATGGNRSEAARRAGLTRQGLLYHLRSLGLQKE